MRKNTFIDQTKHFFSLIGFLFKTTWKWLRDKRTWLAILFIVWSWGIAWFNSNYYTQSPVKEWQPVIVPRYKAVKKIVKKSTVAVNVAVVEEKPYIWNARIEKLYQKIRTLESGKGTNLNMEALHNKCRAKKMINEIGYLVTPDYCFMDEEHQKLTFSRWYAKHEQLTDNQFYCLWNTGTIQNSCSYSIQAEQI